MRKPQWNIMKVFLFAHEENLLAYVQWYDIIDQTNSRNYHFSALFLNWERKFGNVSILANKLYFFD